MFLFWVLDGTEVHRIMDAMETIVSSTGKCVEFVPRTTEPDFVYITAREKGFVSFKIVENNLYKKVTL